MKLNEYQEQAVRHIDGPCLVVACPGSGKTGILTERIGLMSESGISLKNVVCLTFTNKAADEMKERISKRLGVSKPSCFIGTFHKLCVKLLRKFGDRIGYQDGFTIVDSNDQLDILMQIARQKNMAFDKKDARMVAKVANDYRENIMQEEDLYESLNSSTELTELVEAYFEKLRSSNMIDFSGLLSETIRLLKEHEDILHRVQEAFKYLQIDEVQDTNYAQFVLINMFSAKWNNVLMVGDLNQSIYKFRGARYQNIKDFIDHHKDCKVIELPINYRSTPQIVSSAHSLIKNNSSYMGTKFETINDSGSDVRLLPFRDQLEEADFVAKYCKKLVGQGWNPHDIAILYRINAMSEPIERALSNQQIPYVVVGGRSFFDRREIKDLIAMLRFSVNRRDGIAFHRCMKLFPGVGDGTIGKIEILAMEQDVDLAEATRLFCAEGGLSKIQRSLTNAIDKLVFDIQNMDVFQVLEKLVEDTEYENILSNDYEDEEVFERMENVRQLLSSASDFALENKGDSIVNYLHNISLVSSSDKRSVDQSVSLMSMHAAKGLEFPIVFIIGVEESIVPHSLAISDDPLEGVEEERRLFYVAMTRAKQHLYISFCRFRKQIMKGGRFWNKPSKASRFIAEAGLMPSYQKN